MYAVVVADSPAADLNPYLDLLRRADLLIAADGGAQHCLSVNMQPHAIVGDLDSLPPHLIGEFEAAGVEIRRFPATKDETDLELALVLAVERGATSIDVLAALGGRPDMHFANHLLLAHAALIGREVTLRDAGWSIRLVRDSITLHGQPHTIVSLLPLDGTPHVSTSGLAYPLHDEPLYIGPARGVSNVMIASTALVEVRDGTLLLFVQEP